MKQLICIFLIMSVTGTFAIAQMPFGGLVVQWQFVGDITEVSNFEELSLINESSSPYSRINKTTRGNPYARGNLSQQMPLNHGNNHIVPEYLLTTVPRKDNIIIGGMMLATFAASGIPGPDFGNSGQNMLTLSCMATTAVTFVIVQIWHKRKK